MTRSTFVLFFALMVAGCSSSRPTEEQLKNADYGPYPENYMEIAKGWLTDQYTNLSTSGVRDVRIDKPVKGYQLGGLFDDSGPVYGYETEMTYSVTAPSGRRTVTTRYRVLLLIRDGKIVKYKEMTQ